ncbi:MAG TPA: hypothetical protein VM870_06250 [Pyrinomonadaceae bacterium]|nr:hypothetical protein [Pyrinomonadaceae bacterium]
MKPPFAAFSRRRQNISASVCGLAFSDDNDEVVMAERSPLGGFHVWSAPRGEERALNITASEIRTAIIGHSAHTERFAQYEAEGLDDRTLLGVLADAVNHHPQREALAFGWARTPNNIVALTQAERADVERTTKRVADWLERQKLPHWRAGVPQRVRVETATRAVARLWLSEAGPRRLNETVAFLIVGREGYAVGLWNAATGLAYETEEKFEPDATADMATAHTGESLLKLISPVNLARLSLGEISTVVVSIVRVLDDALSEWLRRELTARGISFERVSFRGAAESEAGKISCRAVELDQATALALGSLFDDAQIRLIDLARDVTAEHEELLRLDELTTLAATRSAANGARAAIFAPFVLGLGVLCASYLDTLDEASTLRQQTAAEQQRGRVLAAEAALRVAARQHFAEYVALTDQTLELRRRQPATAQLLNDLNQQWPGDDASWFISEMKTMAGGVLEFKGRTKKEEAVTAFTHGLEFSNGLFVGVSNNIQSATTGGPGVAPPFVTENAPPALDFIVRAVYTPLRPVQAGINGAPPSSPALGGKP